MRTILFYGSFCDKQHKLTTGLTVVSSIVLELMEREYDVIKVNIADKRIGNRGSISFTLYRSLQFFAIFVKLFSILLFRKVDIVYYQPVYSSLGICRDYIALHIISLFNKTVVGHALGVACISKIASSETRIGKMCTWNFNQMTKIIVEGDKMKQQFSIFPDYDTRVIVIPNGFNEESDDIKLPKQYQNGEPFKLLYLSNLIFSKGYYDVLRALDILVNKEQHDVVCVFAGRFYKTLEEEDNDKELAGEEAFNSFIEDHHLKNRVMYYTGLYGLEKQKAFNESNAFLLPTYYSAEGQPMAILEAMSYGCVPVVTKNGHIPNMINENNGSFVEERSPESIAARIKELIEDKDLYTQKSLNAINDFKNKFSGDVFSRAVVSVVSQNISN